MNKPIDLSSIDALLFDLGGVVIQIRFDRVMATWASHAGVPAADLTARFSFDQPYMDHEVGLIDSTAYFATLRESLGIDLTDAEFSEGWVAIYDSTIPGIESVLAQAKQRWPVYGFTNSNDAHIEIGAELFADSWSMFDKIFVSSQIGLRKPTKEAFEYVSQDMGVALDRILFFDDTAENVEGARAVGMPAVLVSSIDDVRGALELS